MRVVMFIIGGILVLSALRRLVLEPPRTKAEKSEKNSGQETEGKRGLGTILLLAGVVLLVFGSNLGDRVGSVNLGESGLEIVFTPEPAKLTPEQVAGAQRAQQIRLLAPAQNTGTSTASVASLFENMKRNQQEQTEVLHQALALEAFTPAPDPMADLGPGAVVRVGQDGSVSLQFNRLEAFPQLKVRSSNFDFVQFTSLRGTRPGFTWLGSAFVCQQGFREDMDLSSYVSTPIAAGVNNALRQDSSLHIVRSVIGCHGKNFSLLASYSASHDPGRCILGFQLATTSSR